MSIIDYDKVVDYIEDNISLERRELKNNVRKMLGLTDRRAGEFFQNINPEGKTVADYIKTRKVYKALDDFVQGETAEAVSEKYGLGDHSNFYLGVKAMENKPPIALRKEGFKYPKPLHIKDILGELDSMPEVNNNAVNAENYVAEIKRLIDENEKLKNEVSYLTKDNIQHEKAAKEGMLEMGALNISAYKEFLKLDDLRVTYNFRVDDFIKIYEKHLKTGEDLETLCENALYSFEFDCSLDDDSDYQNDQLAYRLQYEMDSEEAWEYYYVDDEIIEKEKEPYDEDYALKPEYDISDDDYYDSMYNEYDNGDDQVPDDIDFTEDDFKELSDDTQLYSESKSETKEKTDAEEMPDSFQYIEDLFPF